MLFLRTCKKDGTSHNGYKWNLEIGAINEAPDFNTRAECGGGLHGLPNGCGNGQYLDWSDDAIGVVFSADEDIINIDDKSKVKRATVIFTGSISDCAKYIYNSDKSIIGIVGLVIDCGDRSMITGGDGSTITGGDGSMITGGDGSTITGGDRSTITGGDRSTITGGYRSTITGGYGSTITGGYGSTITGGDGSTVQVKYYDGKRFRISTGYIGEDGLLPNVKYRYNTESKLWEVAE